MLKKNCPKLVKNIFILVGVALSLYVFLGLNNAYAISTNTINLQGKIVRNDTGYEGLNVTTGSPACVLAGGDECNFKVRYYNESSSGTLLLEEIFEDVEIGDYKGAFNLSLGTNPTPAVGTYGSTPGQFDDMILLENQIYVEIQFDPTGNETYPEVFSRMPLQASAFAIRSKYSSHASTAFQFDTATDDSGYTGSAGMVYFDTTDNVLKVYDGTSWLDMVSSGGSGSSLWTDSGAYTYLTDTTDHVVFGSSSYTAIGSSTYATYVAGLGSIPPLSFDMGAERLTLTGSQSRSGLTVYSDYSSTTDWPLVLLQAQSSSYGGSVLDIVQYGTGNLMALYKGSSEAFLFENDLTFYIKSRDTAPTTTDHRLYNVSGDLYWAGELVLTGSAGGSSLWTDGGTFSYLTSTTDDLVLGASTTAASKFFFDVSEGRLGIGTDTPSAAIDIVGASSVISNTSGAITLIPDTNLIIKANDTANDVFLIAQDNTGAERFRIHADTTDNFYAGYQAGSSNVSGVRNTFVGAGSGTDNTGDYNTALGMQTLFKNTSGTRNVAIGTQALFNVTTGTDNLGLGYRSLFNNTGNDNAAFGSFSSYYNSTGIQNTAFGSYALYHNTTGSGNVAIGFHAGRGSGASAYAQNTIIGYQAGYSLASGSDGNVFLGYSAGYSETGSNKLYIANSNTSSPLIYGEFDNGLLKISGDLQPGANNTYEFGSSTNRWSDVYSQGTVYVGANGNSGGVRYNTTNNELEFSNDGTNWIPMAGISRTESLSAEYPGAVLAADGTNNTGFMTADAEGTAANSMNYYEWNSSETTLQDYDIRLRFTLPSDFAEWGTTAFTFYYATESTSSANNKVDFYVYEQGSATVDGSSTDKVSSVAGTWTTATIAGSALTECDTAGETCVIIIRQYSKDDYYSRVGDIKINYNRKL